MEPYRHNADENESLEVNFIVGPHHDMELLLLVGLFPVQEASQVLE